MFQAGKKLNTRYFAIYAKPNQLTHPRLGLVLTKKTIRLAVMRNQFKRLIRESFRQNQQLLSGFDVMAVAYPAINTLNKFEFRDFLEQQWAKSVTSWVKP